MKTFTIYFLGAWASHPAVAIVTAKNEDRAKTILTAELIKKGFTGTLYDVIEINITEENIEILSDGEY